MKCVEDIQVEMYQMQTQNANPFHPTMADPSADIHYICTCLPIFQYLFEVFRTLWGWDPTTYLEEKVLTFYSSKKRAAHIKVAQSLYKESFLAALIGFIARRGSRTPSSMTTEWILLEQLISWKTSLTSRTKIRLRMTELWNWSFGTSIHLQLLTLVESGSD